MNTVVKHIAMANKLAAKYAAYRPCERDEILSAAYFGLVKAAARKHNPANSYIAHCITGEIKNAFHSTGSLTRSERRFLADYLDHAGNMSDRADAMGIPHDVVFKRLARMTFVVPLFRNCTVAAPEPGDLDELLEVCLKYLPERLHWVFLCKYRDQLTQEEIRLRTGFGHDTVFRILAQAKTILRANKEAIAQLVF